MRGCLFVLVVAAALIAVGAWFGAAPLTATVITSILEGSGYHATSSTVTAGADPPLRLLVGHADRVTVDGSGVTWRTFRAAQIDLTLGDVDLFGRTAGSIHGTITGAELQTTDQARLPPRTSASTAAGAMPPPRSGSRQQPSTSSSGPASRSSTAPP